MLGGYSFLTPEALQRALVERSIAEAQIDRALAVLSGPDPAGLLGLPTREQVEHVAAYMHGLLNQVWMPSPYWYLIERGHPAAQAIYWHESQELESYRLLGVRNPLEVSRPSDTYWQAHARGSWLEAQYWAAWAMAEGQPIPTEAFAQAHPMRAPEERQLIVLHLRNVWSVGVGESGMVALRAADRFYRDKLLTPGEIARWLSR
jgi:hypothetical protein